MEKPNDIYSRITQKIIDDLEKGQLTWRKPWSDENLAHSVMRPLSWNGTAYKGINTIMLWATAAEKGYQYPHWLTMKKIAELKGSLLPDQEGCSVVYYDYFDKEEKASDGTVSTKRVPFLKSSIVYNASQIEGLPPSYYKEQEPRVASEEVRDEILEKFFACTEAQIFTGGKAAYSLDRDCIEMPPFECFNTPADYYATLAHELTHWTRHPRRLDREFNRKAWGDEGYAKEELVAEIGACFLGADLGFEPITKEEHAAYIQSWLKVLKNDNRFIFQAASFAQKAVEYVMALQPNVVTAPKALHLQP